MEVVLLQTRGSRVSPAVVISFKRLASWGLKPNVNQTVSVSRRKRSRNVSERRVAQDTLEETRMYTCKLLTYSVDRVAQDTLEECDL